LLYHGAYAHGASPTSAVSMCLKEFFEVGGA
jgi:hypothetical protein